MEGRPWIPRRSSLDPPGLGVFSGSPGTKRSSLDPRLFVVQSRPSLDPVSEKASSLDPRTKNGPLWLPNFKTVHQALAKLLPAWQGCLRGRLRSRCGRRWRGRRRPLHACLRRFRAGDFAAGADSDDKSAQQVWMEMARHANCNPKSRTLNPSSMMQADSSATLSEPVVASIQLRRFREPDPKNSVAFACCDPWCPRSCTMRHVTLKAEP